MSVDPYIVVALSAAAVLALCVGILFTMRDRTSAPAHVAVCSLRCPARKEPAVVAFLEHTTTGIPIRAVESCSLRGINERCEEECRYSKRVELGMLRRCQTSPARG